VCAGSAALCHLKPSITLKPTPRLGLLAAAALQWRQTPADSIYVQPNVAVASTAGHGGRRAGSYEQLRADYAIDEHLAGAIEAVRYQAGEALRSVGGHDSSYLGIELKSTW